MGRAFDITCRKPWLTVRFPHVQRMASWSVNRPGLVDATEVAWLEVGKSELAVDLDPRAWFAGRLAEEGLGEAVGMMTARDVGSFVHRTATVGDVRAECIVTAGLNNGERVGRRLGDASRQAAGTINILSHVSVPLDDSALLEAAAIAVQARTVAILELGHTRPGLAGPVTGTGTDCVVMASPVGPSPLAYAGMHTEVGEAVGASVLEATRIAAREWLDRRA